MKNNRRSLCFWSLLIAATTLGAYSCGDSSTGEQGAVAHETTGTAERRVRVVAVERRDYEPTLVVTGSLVARRHAVLRAMVDGDLEELPVDIGDEVGAGELLFQIRLTDYRLALQRAEAALAEVEAAVEDAVRERQRLEGLYADGAATEQMRDKAITVRRLAEAAVERVRAARDTAAQQLEDATVFARYPAVITARFREQGEFMKKGDPVLEVTDLSVLNAELDIPERFVGLVVMGMSGTLGFEAGVEDAVGKVVAINPKVDRASRTFRVKVAVDNSSRALSAGMFCTATIELPREAGLAAIPEAAVIRDEGRSWVWIVEEGHTFQRLIEEAGSSDGFVLTRAGIQLGQEVVIDGFGGLVDGSAVVVEDQ